MNRQARYAVEQTWLGILRNREPEIPWRLVDATREPLRLLPPLAPPIQPKPSANEEFLRNLRSAFEHLAEPERGVLLEGLEKAIKDFTAEHTA